MSDSVDPHHVPPFVNQIGTKRLLQFSIQAIQSSMDLDQPEALEIEYTRLMMGFLLFTPAPARIVMIGLGGGSMAKFCHRHLPMSRLCVVEINPHVLALRDTFQVPPDSERFRVLLDDGADFVRAPPEPAEPPTVLLVDGFDYDGLPEALSSQQFYDDCFDLLTADGVLVVNLPAGHADFTLQVERIRRSFKGANLAVDDSEHTNCVVFARKGAPLSMAGGNPLRRPRHLDGAAWLSLQESFARILSVMKDETSAP